MTSSLSSFDAIIDPNEHDDQATRYFMGQVIFPIIGGFMFGYDTGVISGALIPLRDHFKLTNVDQEIVVSATILFAALSSLVAGFLSNKFGRKITIIISCVCFIIGALLLGFAFSVSVLILGRIVVGIGVGLSATCCPVYIAEISPKNIRGRLVVSYQISITAGLFVSSLINATLGKDLWRYMLGIAVIPSLIEFIGMFTVPESYRWLISKDRVEEARIIIEKQKYVPEDKIDQYIEEIIQSNKDMSDHRTSQQLTDKNLLYQIFKDKEARQSLLLGCFLQMLAQIIGINTIMYYTASVIRMSGVDKMSTVLWLSAFVSFFNFMPSIIGFVLIDKIGRRKLAIISLIGVLLSLVLLAIAFQVLTNLSPHVTYIDSPLNGATEIYCSKKQNCEECVTSSSCGFCYLSSYSNSTCLATTTNFQNSTSGWCSKGNKLNATWWYGYCISSYSWIVILGMILYLISFTVGMGPIPWTISSEIYPDWCRNTNMALSTATNWTFNLIITFTFLSLTESITKYGTFWLYSSFAFCGLLIVYRYLPETNQKSLEEMRHLISSS